MDKKERLLDEIADAYGEIDDLVEEHEEEVKRRFDILLNEEGERVPSIWKAGECPLNVTIDLLMRVPVPQRGEQWEMLGKRLVSCAYEQAWVEVMSIPFLKVATKHAARVDKARQSLSRSDVRSIAKIGPGKARFEEKRNGRRARRAG